MTPASEIGVEIDIVWDMSEEIETDFADELLANRLVITGDLDFLFEIEAGFSAEITIDLARRKQRLHFRGVLPHRPRWSFLILTSPLPTRDLVALTTDVSDSENDFELNLGGSIYYEDGSFQFSHEHNLADTVSFEN